MKMNIHSCSKAKSVFKLGATSLRSTAGSYVVKPRGKSHAFWNAGTTMARIQEIIYRPDSSGNFSEVADVLASGGPPDMPRIMEIAGR